MSLSEYGFVLFLFIWTYWCLWWGYTSNDKDIMEEMKALELKSEMLERRLEIANDRILHAEERVNQLERHYKVYNP